MEQFPEVNYVYNPFFDTTNTSKSLLRALKKHRGNSILWFLYQLFIKMGIHNIRRYKRINFITLNIIPVWAFFLFYN